MLFKNSKRWLFFLFPLLSLFSCELPPAAYILNTPLLFQCSTNYDPNSGTDAEFKAFWTNSCSLAANPWIRFSVHANQKAINGFVFYHDAGSSTDYNFFQGLVKQHIVNDIIVPNPTNIIPFIANDTCSSKDPSGVDRGQEFPSIYTVYPTSYSNTLYNIKNLDTIFDRQTSVIIPPLTCLPPGTFVVTTVDYINTAESQASNILELTP